MLSPGKSNAPNERWQMREIGSFFVDYVKIYFVRCRRCGQALIEGWGRTAEEAVQEAVDRGWKNGWCRNCWIEVVVSEKD